MLQVVYTEGDDRLFIRKAEGSEDISGDWNEYSEINTVTVGTYEVTMKGENGLISVALWTEGAYTYSVVVDTPIAQETMTALISQIA